MPEEKKGGLNMGGMILAVLGVLGTIGAVLLDPILHMTDSKHSADIVIGPTQIMLILVGVIILVAGLAVAFVFRSKPGAPKAYEAAGAPANEEPKEEAAGEDEAEKEEAGEEAVKEEEKAEETEEAEEEAEEEEEKAEEKEEEAEEEAEEEEDEAEEKEEEAAGKDEAVEYECPSCGAPVGENDNKCPKCGAEFE